MRALILACLLVCMACTNTQRQTTLKTTLVTVDAARDAFAAFDTTIEQSIVAQATSVADGEAKLAAYRADRTKIRTYFATAYHAIAAAAIANDDQSITSMQAAVAQLIAAVTPYLGASK